MDPVGPAGGINPGEKRPLINLANGGDMLGNSHQPYQATRYIMEYVRNEIEAKLRLLNLNGVIYNG